MKTAKVADARYLSQRQLWITSLGVVFEWYDFCIYFYLKPQLTTLFFSVLSSHHGTLFYYLSFALSYLVRPLGAIYFGQYSDRRGRKAALLQSMRLIFIAAVVLACVPTFQASGSGFLVVMACVILLASRLLQGFAMGGEYMAVQTIVYEGAITDQRGIGLAKITAISSLGILLAIGISRAVMLLGPAAMLSYGWRACFFLGAIFTGCVYYLQKSVPDVTWTTLKKKRLPQPLRYVLKHHKARIFLSAVLVGAISLPYILYTLFLPNYFAANHFMSGTKTAWLQFLTMLLTIPGSFLGGYLVDRNRPSIVVITTLMLMIIFCFPATVALHHGFIFPCLVQILLYSVCAIATCYLINDIFPLECRASGAFLGYGLGNAIFCGLSPLIYSKLAAWQQQFVAVNEFVCGFMLFSVFLLLYFRYWNDRIHYSSS